MMKYLNWIFLLMLSSLLQQLPAQGELAILAEAQRAYNDEDFDQTLALLSEAGDSLQTFEALLLKGDALQKSELYGPAIEAYNQAETLNSHPVELYINRASAKIWNGNYNLALEDLKRARSLDKHQFKLYYYEGIAQYYLLNLKPAIKALNDCLKLNENYAPAFYLRAACFGELHKFEQAISDYSKAYDLDPTLTEALFNIAVLKYIDKDYYSAQQDFSQLLESELNNKSDIYYYRAECAYYLNDKQAACMDYDAAAKAGDEVAAEIYDKYCLKGKNREDLPQRKTESISL